jgi:hypothetical protein
MSAVVTEGCDCEWAKRHKHYRSGEAAAQYLRDLADRVERGAIRHVSVSAHPIGEVTE